MPDLHASFNRRRLLAAGAAAALAAHVRAPVRGADAAAPTVDTLLPGKNPRMLIHKAEPIEMETPLDVLDQVDSANITPIENLFVRNNFQPDWAVTLEPPDRERPWSLEFAGLTEFPRTLSLADVAELPRVDCEMVLQCSGNGRSLFGRAAPVKGAPWTRGAVANVRFGGVKLKSVLEKFGIAPHSAAKFLTAEGGDEPAKSSDADFEHSIPLADALERSILALDLNGNPLPAVHGGPLRLITPGYYGTMQIKWLTRLRFEAQETVNHHQVKRYRTPLTPIEPGAEFEYGLDNSEPNWNMRIKSIVVSPAEGAAIPLQFSFAGYAWNDGQSRIEAVEWSIDDGATWRRAQLERPTSPYAWYPFQADVRLERGERVFMCRAVDALGRTQPVDGAIGWNPAGYGWNGVERIRVEVGS